MPPASRTLAHDDDDLVDYPWENEGDEAGEVEAVEGEWEEWDGECGVADDEGLAWDGDEAEAAAANVEVDLAFEGVNATHDAENDGRHERAMIAKLRKDIEQLLRPQKFELEPFGSYVTNLGLPNSDGSGRSDLDVVLLFHGKKPDSVEAKDIRETLVLPTIDRLGAWLKQRSDVSVKNIVRKARVPIVTFGTRELEVDLSVQQPWGVLNSWHLRDLCDSGRPGRLRLLVRLAKMWAKSKSIHTAKDGALSSYGYAMLAAAYLRECDALPALLPRDVKQRQATGPYLSSDSALQEVLAACRRARASVGGDHAGAGAMAGAQRRCGLWREPEPLPAGVSVEADVSPLELFVGWLDWLSGTVLRYVKQGKDVAAGCGAIPLARRHIVSVRNRSQEDLRMDVTWSKKCAEHWSPSKTEVFMLVEEPLTGENVARTVKSDGFWAIYEEVQRACNFFAERGTTSNGDDEDGLGVFRALLELPPLTTREQLPNGLGVPGGPRGGDGWKRTNTWDDAEEPPSKRPRVGQSRGQTPAVWQPYGKGPGKGGARPFFGAVPTGFRVRPSGPAPGAAVRPGLRPSQPKMPPPWMAKA